MIQTKDGRTIEDVRTGIASELYRLQRLLGDMDSQKLHESVKSCANTVGFWVDSLEEIQEAAYKLAEGAANKESVS